MTNGDKIQLTIYQVDSKIHYKKNAASSEHKWRK